MHLLENLSSVQTAEHRDSAAHKQLGFGLAPRLNRVHVASKPIIPLCMDLRRATNQVLHQRLVRLTHHEQPKQGGDESCRSIARSD
jgi:hypothetical protein